MSSSINDNGISYSNMSGAHQSLDISAVATSNTLVLTLQPCKLSFKNPTLGSGTPVNVEIASALTCTIPQGATLGTTNAIAARFVPVVYYNGGSPVLGVVNLAGGNQLDGTNLVSPTIISASSTSASTFYSASSVSASSPYVVAGLVDNTQATAGTYATQPSMVIGATPNLIGMLSSLGVGQTWQNVTGSRVSGTTYYNTTGRPIQLMVAPNATGFSAISIDGVSINGTGNNAYFGAVIKPGGSYALTGTINQWQELR